MNVIVTSDYQQSCLAAAEIMQTLVNNKPDAKLGLATGGTPVPIYKKLIEMHKQGQLDFSKVRTVNLDEYCGLNGDHPQSYRFFMDDHLFNHVNIDKKNTHVAKGIGEAEANAKELEEKVFEGGTPDLQLLGIGSNGHIGFNEAGSKLQATSHIESLTEGTIEANARFFEKKEDVPTLAISMGMRGILAAKSIVLVASGAAKKDAIRGLIGDDFISTENPSTFLKLHPNVTVIIDKELADLAGYKA